MGGGAIAIPGNSCDDPRFTMSFGHEDGEARGVDQCTGGRPGEFEIDAGLTGVGEGGAENTMEQCASMLIGEDPFRTDRHWQMMYRGYFYPAGREKVHALGALDVALWDLKAKALGA